MNAQASDVSPLAIGLKVEGGYFAGRILINGEQYGLVVSDKSVGDFDDIAWNKSTKSVLGALSWNDGLANSQAMAKAGSTLAKRILDLTIEGHSDWYLPAQDELEVCYRAFKPTEEENWLYARSGINLSAVPPTYPYVADFPLQTPEPLFQADGAQAFESAAYWTSTQHASSSGYAWYQGFGYGNQGNYGKDFKRRARAVRRFKL